MLGAYRQFPNRERTLEKRLGLGIAVLALKDAREVVERDGHA